MMNKDNGGPAFPVEENYCERTGGYTQYGSEGMTLRDYFAAKAMQGIFSGNGLGFMGFHSSHYDNVKGIARISYEIADAMLAERAK